MDDIVQASVQRQEHLVLPPVGCYLKRRFNSVVTAKGWSSQFFSDQVCWRCQWLFSGETEENVVQQFRLIVSVHYQACLSWFKIRAHFLKILLGVPKSRPFLVFYENWNCRGADVEKTTCVVSRCYKFIVFFFNLTEEMLNPQKKFQFPYLIDQGQVFVKINCFFHHWTGAGIPSIESLFILTTITCVGNWGYFRNR